MVADEGISRRGKESGARGYGSPEIEAYRATGG
jgi:hypothetical protein